MSDCKIGMPCDLKPNNLLNMSAPLVFSGRAGLPPQTPNVFKSPNFTRCLELVDDYNNARRIRPVLAGLTGAGAAGTGALILTKKSEESEDKSVLGTIGSHPALLTGAATVGTGSWFFIENKSIRRIREEYIAKKCDSVIRNVGEGIRIRTLNLEFTPTPLCEGADVLIWGCTPERRPISSSEWSTEPIPPEKIALGVGIIAVGALATYFGITEIAALARVAAPYLAPAAAGAL